MRVEPRGAFGEAELVPAVSCHRCLQPTADSLPARYYVEDGGRVGELTVPVCPGCDEAIALGNDERYAHLDECDECHALREDCETFLILVARATSFSPADYEPRRICGHCTATGDCDEDYERFAASYTGEGRDPR